MLRRRREINIWSRRGIKLRMRRGINVWRKANNIVEKEGR